MSEKPTKPSVKFASARESMASAGMKRPSSPQAEAVGYKQPPVETRFRKGVSGNPKGRPKKLKPAPRIVSDTDDLHDELAAHLSKPMTIREDGKVQEVPRIVAFVRNLERIAAKGSVRATETLIRMLEEMARQQTRKRDEDIALWRRYKENYHEARKRAEETGKPFHEWLPHPEDITIVAGVGVRIRGHVCAETYAALLELKRIRDASFLKMIYDWEYFEKETTGTLTMASFVVFAIDGLFPQRWRNDAPEQKAWQMRVAVMSRDRLRWEMLDAWQEIRRPLALDRSVLLDRPMPPVPPALMKILSE